MTDHYCTTCNRQVLHDGTTCCVCAGKGEMPEPDCYGTSPTHDPDIGAYYEWHGWHVGADGTTTIERYAQAKAADAEKAIRERDAAIKEISRYAIQTERLREYIDGIPDMIRELMQFVDPAHHKKFLQLSNIIDGFKPKETPNDPTP